MARLISVVEAVSQASMEIGIAQRPVSGAMASDDQDISQMVALLSSVAEDVLSESPYREALSDGYWLQTVDGVPLDAPKQDTDIILFAPRLAINGLKYRFLHAKGLEYGEQLRDFTATQNRFAARANARVLDLDAEGSCVQ